MNNDKLNELFEPELLREMNQFGTFQIYKEGDLVMVYRKYVRMMPKTLRYCKSVETR